MKLNSILFVSYFSVGLAASHHDILVARGSSRSNSPLRTPLIYKSPETGVKAKVTATSGPYHPSTVLKNHGWHNMGTYNDVGKGKTKTFEKADTHKAKVGGWAGRGGKIETEMTAPRVKVKMNIPKAAVATVSQKQDGRWSEPKIISDQGVHRKYYANDDRSPVTVKATIAGGGKIRSTGQNLPRPMKAGREYERN